MSAFLTIFFKKSLGCALLSHFLPSRETDGKTDVHQLVTKSQVALYHFEWVMNRKR